MKSLVPTIYLVLAFSFPYQILSSRSYGVEMSHEKASEGPKLQLTNSTQGNRLVPSRVIQLSWHPRAFLSRGFLSDEECDHLISLAQGKLKKNFELGIGSKELLTGSGMFLDKGQDEVVARIEDRIAAWTLLPKENGEKMMVLHYGLKEHFKPHYDYYQDKFHAASSRHRIATVIMFLSSVSQGGETVFPRLGLKDTRSKDKPWSGCVSEGYGIKPIKGYALLVFNLHPNMTTDKSSIHGSCPVIEGEKWSATKWIHFRAFNVQRNLSWVSSSSDGDECTDEHDNCLQWAARGECQKNPVYMLGTPDYYGTCRKSCKVC